DRSQPALFPRGDMRDPAPAARQDVRGHQSRYLASLQGRQAYVCVWCRADQTLASTRTVRRGVSARGAAALDSGRETRHTPETTMPTRLQPLAGINSSL